MCVEWGFNRAVRTDRRRRDLEMVSEGPYMSIWGNSIPGGGNSLYEGREAGPCLECWQSREETPCGWSGVSEESQPRGLEQD